MRGWVTEEQAAAGRRFQAARQSVIGPAHIKAADLNAVRGRALEGEGSPRELAAARDFRGCIKALGRMGNRVAAVTHEVCVHEYWPKVCQDQDEGKQELAEIVSGLQALANFFNDPEHRKRVLSIDSSRRNAVLSVISLRFSSRD
jgi:hypothetical protein